MPITSIPSFRSTTEAFAVNWALANSELGTNPLILAGNYTLADFIADRTALLALMDAVDNANQVVHLAITERGNKKVDLMTRGKQFRGEVQGQITAKDYLMDLPALPSFSQDYDKFTKPLRAMARLWERINLNADNLGLSGPLTSAGGYTLLQFQNALDALVNFSTSAENAEGDLGQVRGQRDNAATAIYERMKQYRKIAPARLPANSPALAQLPRLTPPPGTTPPPLGVSGAWDPTINKGSMTWVASTATNIDKLQVRGCTGGTYRNENEEVIADLPADATHFETDWALSVQGSIASFKVYVMTTTGNENGGKPVKIVRPET